MTDGSVGLRRRQLLSLGALGVGAISGCTEFREEADGDEDTVFGYGGAPAESEVQNADGRRPDSDDSPLDAGSNGTFFPGGQGVQNLRYEGESYGVIGYGERGYGGATVVGGGNSEPELNETE